MPGLKERSPIFSSDKMATLMVFLLVIALGLWGGFLFYKKNIEKEISGVKQEIKTLEEARDLKMVEKITSFEEGISGLKEILSGHKYTGKIFGLLEENTLPEVAWNNFSLEAVSGKIFLEGVAKTYSFVAKQMKAFENSPLSEVEISEVELGDEGGVSFGLEIGFDAKILTQ